MNRRLGFGQLPGPLRRAGMRPVVRRLSAPLRAIDRRRLRSGRRTVGGWLAGGVPVLLLTTTGRRSGLPRTVPLLHHRSDDGTLLLVAANGAADWDPDWLANLVADPRVEVEVDGRGHAGVAHVLSPVEREATWPTACAAFPGLARAQHRCRRTIPLVRVTFPPE